MRRGKLILAGAVLTVAATVVGGATAAETAEHRMIAADQIEWGPAPPGLPPGSQAAVLSGNPAAEGSFTLRAKLPDGYRIPPHWHGTVENLTVISGTMHMGMGERADPAGETAMKPGDFAAMPAGTRHWVRAEGDVVLQVHGVGPFSITYVDPADDPRGQTGGTQ
jgi:quercetin dioxygenase-like cupin family protein